MDLKWKYSKEQTPSVPIVELSLSGFPIKLVVDTGFAGGILIPFPLFQSLGLLYSLTLDVYYAVMPDSRRINLQTSRAQASLSSSNHPIQVDVHSSPLLDKMIVGRSFLEKFVAILDGARGELTLRG